MPALKKALSWSTFEHSLVLSKNDTISSTNWENQHYFETLSALTLKFRTSFNHCSKFEFWKRLRYLCSKYHVKFDVNRLIMTASHGDISVQGSLTAQKEHARFCRSSTTSRSTWWSYRATWFGVATSPGQMLQIYPLLSMEWIWTCGLAHRHHLLISVRWTFSVGAPWLNEHYLKFCGALNQALNAEKTRDAQSTKSKFHEPFLKLSALCCCNQWQLTGSNLSNRYSQPCISLLREWASESLSRFTVRRDKNRI